MTTTTKVKVVSDGSWQLDGGAVFGGMPKSSWEVYAKPDRTNKVRLGLNCVLIKTPKHKILINAGIGTTKREAMRDEYGHKTSKLLSQLRREKVSPKDIDYVILTQLHFDHAGGTVKMTNVGTVVPAFPKARYIVQKKAWEEAMSPSPLSAMAYGPGKEYLQVLEDNDLVDFIDGDCELLPGVKIEVAGGYSQGHSIVKINSGSERYMYLADLVPTPAHLNLPCITAYDQQPTKTFTHKQTVLDDALKNGWIVIFAHGYEHASGYMTSSGLRPVEI